MKKILIVSTARSATGYIAALLQNCGLDVTHERWAGIQECMRKPYGRWNLPESDGESSWLSVPIFRLHPHLLEDRTKCVLLHQLRNPFITLRSWMRLGKLRQYHIYDQWVYHQDPIRDGNHATQLVRHWIQWHELIESLHPDLRYRVEDMDTSLLQEILDLAEVPQDQVRREDLSRALQKTPTTTNSRGQADFHVKDVKPEIWEAFVVKASEYGYEAPPGYTGRKEDMGRVLNPHQSREVMEHLTEALIVIAGKIFEGGETDARVTVCLDCAMDLLGMKEKATELEEPAPADISNAPAEPAATEPAPADISNAPAEPAATETTAPDDPNEPRPPTGVESLDND